MKPNFLKYFLLLLTICFLPNLSAAQDLEASSPIYIAAILLDEPSSDDMARMCEYYGFTEQSPSDGYRIFTSANGITLRFRIDGTEEHPLPTVEVTTKSSPKEIKGILTQVGYSPEHRNSSTYTRGTPIAQYYTTCNVKNGILTFTKHIGSIPQLVPNRTPNTARQRKLLKSTKHNLQLY